MLYCMHVCPCDIKKNCRGGLFYVFKVIHTSLAARFGGAMNRLP
jgi:hypothetical protein